MSKIKILSKLTSENLVEACNLLMSMVMYYDDLYTEWYRGGEYESKWSFVSDFIAAF